jgi:hypothetical protein
MGSSQSNERDTKLRYAEKREYTDKEIHDNINKWFQDNRSNIPFSEATYSMALDDNDNNNDESGYNVDPMSYQAGGKRNRYQKYDINNYVNNLKGGNRDESDFSEFEKIKEYLEKELKVGQSGGNNLDNEINDMINALNTPDNKNVSPIDIISFLKGGDAEDDEEEETDLDVDELDEEATEAEEESGNDEDEDEDIDAEDKDEDEDEEDIEIDIKSSDNDSSSEEKNKKKKKKHEEKEHNKETTPERLKKKQNRNKYSISSYSSTSSELNILPFYSSTTSSSSYQHPYAKKRF